MVCFAGCECGGDIDAMSREHTNCGAEVFGVNPYVGLMSDEEEFEFGVSACPVTWQAEGFVEPPFPFFDPERFERVCFDVRVWYVAVGEQCFAYGAWQLGVNGVCGLIGPVRRRADK